MTDEKREAADEAHGIAEGKGARAEGATASVVRHPAAAARSSGNAPPVPVSPHLLTGWFGLMALGGVGFGLYAERRPFGEGLLANPLVVLFALTAAGLMTLGFLHQQPVTKLIAWPFLVLGAVIAIVCFLLGMWFGHSLMSIP